ncbi:hypothetical protein COOONC_18660 [Cooperia oncophora]
MRHMSKDQQSTLSPIDFIQNGINLAYPVDPVTSEEIQDESFIPPAQKVALKTRLEAEKALKSSCEITNKFWEIWRKHYVTSLREHHQAMITQGKTTNIQDRKGHNRSKSRSRTFVEERAKKSSGNTVKWKKRSQEILRHQIKPTTNDVISISSSQKVPRKATNSQGIYLGPPVGYV